MGRGGELAGIDTGRPGGFVGVGLTVMGPSNATQYSPSPSSMMRGALAFVELEVGAGAGAASAASRTGSSWASGIHASCSQVFGGHAALAQPRAES